MYLLREDGGLTYSAIAHLLGKKDPSFRRQEESSPSEPRLTHAPEATPHEPSENAVPSPWGRALWHVLTTVEA